MGLGERLGHALHRRGHLRAGRAEHAGRAVLQRGTGGRDRADYLSLRAPHLPERTGGEGGGSLLSFLSEPGALVFASVEGWADCLHPRADDAGDAQARRTPEREVYGAARALSLRGSDAALLYLLHAGGGGGRRVP